MLPGLVTTLAPALRTQRQSDVRAPRVHKLGPERTWGTFPKALCARESLALSPVRDCSGFAMTDHIRCLFAQCQAPFCLIGSESRVPGQPGFRCQKDDLPLAKRAPLSAKPSITGIVGVFWVSQVNPTSRAIELFPAPLIGPSTGFWYPHSSPSRHNSLFIRPHRIS